MCGIVGAFGGFARERFEKAVEKLKHRGPEYQGIFQEENLFLGHARLSIIDPKPEANQPFETAQYVLVFNGEIYNFRELIKKYDLICQTTSDSEVIIKLYEKIGIECLDEFNGMFAFALYDKKEQTITLARDRFGKKPLYYYCENQSFIFASEMKSILVLLDAKPDINMQAVSEYFAYLSPLPPNTFFEGIYKLESAHYMVYDLRAKTLDIQNYYDLLGRIQPLEIAEDKALERIEELLFQSLELRLVSDVEVASLLSGGIDSTFISALYARQSNQKISTFSIGYAEHKQYDELEFARMAAKAIGSNHHEFILTKDQFIETIDDVITQLDEPLGDSACIPVYLLSKSVHDAGFKVVLSGEGSDEIFLGYDRYRQIVEQNEVSKYGGFIEPYTKESLPKLLKHPRPMQRFEKIHENLGSSFRTLSTIDISHWIAEVLMSKVDRMSMAWSLESRAPFLDYRLVEYLLSLSDDVKKGETTKSLLKKIAKKYIPLEIVERQKKGFSSPYFEWYFGVKGSDILPMFERVNSKTDLFSMDYLKLLYNEGEQNRSRQQLWSMIIFSLWFENYYEKM